MGRWEISQLGLACFALALACDTAPPAKVPSRTPSCGDAPVYGGIGDSSATHVSITFQDTTSRAFDGELLCVWIDGQRLFSDADKPTIASAMLKGSPITWQGWIARGSHYLKTEVTWRQHDTRIYLFQVASAHDWDVAPSQSSLVIQAFEQGDATTPLQDRPNVVWKEGAAVSLGDADVTQP